MTYRVWSNGLEIDFLDLRIREVNNAFGKSTFVAENSVVNKAACSRGKVVWILDDSTLKFVGEITGFDEDKKAEIISVSCLDISYRLYTRNSGERKLWTSQTLATIVSQHITPVTGKAKQFSYVVFSPSPITWRNEYGNAITSLAHLAQSLHADWYSDAGNAETRNVGTVDSETAITVAATTFAVSGDGVQESFVYVVSGNAAGKGGMVSSNTTTQLTCLNAQWVTWGLQSGNILQIWRIDGSAPTNNEGWRFIMVQRRGSAGPTETVDLRLDLAEGGGRKPEKVRNVIYVLGRGDGANQLYSKIFHATTVRSTLSAAITAVVTTITLTDASSFPTSGTVIIGWEKVNYTGKTGNDLTGCTRGVDAATGSPAWLAAYAHSAGKSVYLYVTGATTYNETNPQTGSSIALNGIKEYPKAYPEVNNQDMLDFFAQSKLFQFMVDREEGRYRLNRTLTTAVLGDNITLTDFDGSSLTVRLLAIDYDWKTDTHTIEILEKNALDLDTESLGVVDEGITSTIADLRDEIVSQNIGDQDTLSPATGVSSFNGRNGVVSPVIGDYEGWFLKLSGGTLTGSLSFSGVTNSILLGLGTITGHTQNRNWDTQVYPDYGICKSDLVGSGGLFGSGSIVWNMNSIMDATIGKILIPYAASLPGNATLSEILRVGSDLFISHATNQWTRVGGSFLPLSGGTLTGDLTLAYTGGPRIILNDTTSPGVTSQDIQFNEDGVLQSSIIALSGNILINLGSTKGLLPNTTDNHDFGNSTYWWRNIYAQKLYVDDTAHYIRVLSDNLELKTTSGWLGLLPNTVIYCVGDTLPFGAGNFNLGNSADYWLDVSYKTLTDRGCLGSFDGGVELRDGRILSDIDALLSIKIHPTRKTIYGVPRFDYKTMPKAVYKKAEINGIHLLRDSSDMPYIDMKDMEGKPIRKYAEDGAEMTALISIMIGGIKELHNRLAKLEPSQD